MELRSFSTPDFKNLQEHESSSPYISLELLGDGDGNNEDESDWDSDDSFTDSESVIDDGGGVTPTVPGNIQEDSSSSTDTSSGLQIFRKPKTLKRPANRKMSNKLKDCLMKTSSIEKVRFCYLSVQRLTNINSCRSQKNQFFHQIIQFMFQSTKKL